MLVAHVIDPRLQSDDGRAVHAGHIVHAENHVLDLVIAYAVLGGNCLD